MVNLRFPAFFFFIHCLKAACDRDPAGAMFLQIRPLPSSFYSALRLKIASPQLIKATAASEARVLEKHEKITKSWQNIFLKTTSSSITFAGATRGLKFFLLFKEE